jgi:hypothetical protein
MAGKETVILDFLISATASRTRIEHEHLARTIALLLAEGISASVRK